jgi:hypothetical protein
VGFTRTMTGLAPPMRRGIWGLLLEELRMGSSTEIFCQIAMASDTDLRPDIATLLRRRRRGRRLLPLQKTPSHYRSNESEQEEDCAIACHPLSSPAPTLGAG